MSTHKPNWLGIVGVALTAVAMCGGVVGTAYRVFVLTRIEASECRITRLEESQLEQDKRLSEYMHSIDKSLLSLNLFASNIWVVVQEQTHKVGQLETTTYGSQVKGTSGIK